MNKEKKRNAKENYIANSNNVKYEEFVTSYFKWISPISQRKRVEELEKITKSEKKREKRRKK